MGIDITLYCGGGKMVRESNWHPDSLFKMGHFRSSGNELGINNVLMDAIGIDLFNILGIGQWDGEQEPNWGQALQRTVAAQAQYRSTPDFQEKYVDYLDIVIETCLWVITHQRMCSRAHTLVIV